MPQSYSLVYHTLDPGFDSGTNLRKRDSHQKQNCPGYHLSDLSLPSCKEERRAAKHSLEFFALPCDNSELCVMLMIVINKIFICEKNK